MYRVSVHRGTGTRYFELPKAVELCPAICNKVVDIAADLTFCTVVYTYNNNNYLILSDFSTSAGGFSGLGQ